VGGKKKKKRKKKKKKSQKKPIFFFSKRTPPKKFLKKKNALCPPPPPSQPTANEKPRCFAVSGDLAKTPRNGGVPFLHRVAELPRQKVCAWQMTCAHRVFVCSKHGVCRGFHSGARKTPKSFSLIDCIRWSRPDAAELRAYAKAGGTCSEVNDRTSPPRWSSTKRLSRANWKLPSTLLAACTTSTLNRSTRNPAANDLEPLECVYFAFKELDPIPQFKRQPSWESSLEAQFRSRSDSGGTAGSPVCFTFA